MSVIETSATLGSPFLKGITAELADITSQVDSQYALAKDTVLGVDKNEASSLFKNKTSDKARETISGVSAIGKLQKTAEGADYKSDSRISTYVTQFEWEKYTSGITITEEDRDDQIVSEKLDRAKALLVAGMTTLNQHSFDLFNYSQTAQASLPDHLTFYGDGVPFGSIIHPIKGTGGTQSNASATGIPFTEDNLETARLALMAQRGDKAGETLNYGRSKLILWGAPAIEKKMIIATRGEKRSGTANNDVSIYDGLFTTVSSQLLAAANGGSDTRWGLIDPMNTPATFWTRRALTLGTPYVTDSNKNITVDISARYKVGNKDFRGFWVSGGDSAAYAL